MPICRVLSQFEIPLYGDGVSTSVTVDMSKHLAEMNAQPYGAGNNILYPQFPSKVLASSAYINVPSPPTLTGVTLNGPYLTATFSSAPPAVFINVAVTLGG